jgi:hypothetical protein
MIISHLRRFIFVAIPKTGTHSVRQALRQQLGANDLEQVGLFVNKRFPFTEFADIRHGHINLQQIRPCLDEGQFESYFKFAFVRNPYDRFVSYCAFMSRETGQFAVDAKGFMKHVLFQARPQEHVLFQPQHSFLVDGNGELLSDFVGRVEDMQGDYDAICQRLAMASTELGVVNASRRGGYHEYYDDELLQGVKEYYRRDFEIFGYAAD